MKEFTKTNLDRVGEVFIDGNKILRKINSDYKEFVIKIFEIGLIEELIRKGLFVESKLVTQDNAVLVEHKLLEPIIYPYEWTFSMLKLAAKQFIKISEICLKYNIGLHDCHSSNFVFHNRQMQYVDLGTFAYPYFVFPLKEFLESYVFPLTLWSLGLEKTIKFSLMYKTIFPISEYLLIMDSNIRKIDKNFLKKELNKIYPTWTNSVDLSTLRNNIETLELNMATDWEDYYQTKYDQNGNFILTDRFKKIIEYTKLICNDCKTALSLGGNDGTFENELLNHTNIERIIIQDLDSKALENGFKKYTWRQDNKEIFFANYDVVWPVYHPYWQPPEKRFKSEIVYALALTHHLMLSTGARLNFILETISNYSERYVFIEFMPLGLWAPGAKVSIPNWYTEEYFQKNFKYYFKIIHREQLEENRILYIGLLR